jgi:hypothetical protein
MMHFVAASDPLDDRDDEGTDPGSRTRRHGGARSPVSESVVFSRGDVIIQGWALNISRGGLRAALSDSVAVGDEFEVVIGDGEQRRAARIVWVRAEKDGAIVGAAFLDCEGSVPPPEPAPR